MRQKGEQGVLPKGRDETAFRRGENKKNSFLVREDGGQV